MNGSQIIYFFTIPLAGAFFALIEKLWPSAKISRPAAFLSYSLCGVLLFLYYPALSSGTEYSYILGNWSAAVGIAQHLDGTGWLGLCLLYIAGGLILIYSFGEMPYQSPFYFFFMILTSGLAGIILSADLFNLFVCFEIVGLSAYSLVAYLRKSRALYASYKYLLLGSLGTSLFLLGIFIVYKKTGSLSLEIIPYFFSSQAVTVQEKALTAGAFISGIGIKSAFMPFHLWLPQAHANAPHPVSAILSGIVIKISFIALMKLAVRLCPNSLRILLTLAGCITAFAGAGFASLSKDVKVLLAWSSVSQIGFLLAGYGTGAIAGTAFHLINHGLCKSLLFLSLGIIITRTGKRNIGELGGILKKHPFLTVIFFIGALSIMGFPPFFGFYTKKLISDSLRNFPWAYIILWTASAGTMTSFLRLSRIFFGPFSGTEEEIHKRKPSLLTYLPITLLALLVLSLGFGYNFLGPAVSGLLQAGQIKTASAFYTLESLLEFLGTLLIGAGFALLLEKRGSGLISRVKPGIISLNGSLAMVIFGFLAISAVYILSLP